MTFLYDHRGGCEQLCWVVEREAPFETGDILQATEIRWPMVMAGTPLRCGSCEQFLSTQPELRHE